MSTQESQIAIDQPDEKSVLDYLREHPEIFTENTALLANLKIPHPCGDAVSLIEYQVKILREHIQRLNNKLNLMVKNAIVNDRINEKIFNLAYRLINSNDLEQTLCLIEETLFDNFEANNVAIKLLDPNGKLGQTRYDAILDLSDERLKLFEGFIQLGRPYCGRLQLEQLEFLFGKLALQVQSTALLPIGRNCEYGFMAIGSLEKKRFHPGKEITFLAHLSNLITSAIKKQL